MPERKWKDFLYRVIAELYNRADFIEVMDYPRSINRRSIDMVVQLKDCKTLLIKVAYDLSCVPKGEIKELLGLSMKLAIPSIVISEKNGQIQLFEGVVYEKNGAKIVTLETLLSAMDNNDIFIHQDKENFKVKINPDKLKEKRTRSNMSLGEVASILKVSRRSIYEYERGTIEPSANLGEKLVNIFGEDILEPIDLFVSEKGRGQEFQVENQPVDVIEEEIIMNSLIGLGFETYHAKRTVLDIGARSIKDGKRMLIIVRHGKEGVNALTTKAENLEKLSSAMDSKSYIVVNDEKRLAKELEAGNAKVFTLEEFLEVLRENFDKASKEKNTGHYG
ncbi:MAG: helix-turn-helix domain-containing protein [Caldisphaeraceae archaeon]|nr:helix-turn-helix domain-containing protein [Caldisphaeraceae archaeon]